ncbi:MAG TPA: GAF domain-containing protein, partial [Ramlibacter sp.]
MLAPAIPPDEAQRLLDLCRLELLDTAPEARFDRITRTAARLFGVPTALITLVDAERQWFKSRQGLQAESTPRRVSFCGHAVLQEGPLVVPDAKADPRFADNPLVTGEPHVRFYAGMPLHGSAGYRVGSLCVIDQVPRAFSPEDIAALADLAAWAELELNLDSIEHATALARERQQRLQSIFDHAGDAIVTVSAVGAIEAFNPAAIRMFGSDRGMGMSVLDWLAPASRTAIAGALRGVVQGDTAGALRLDLQCLRTDGREFAAEVTVTRTH